MKSSTTGKEMILRTEKDTVTFRKEKFEIVTQYYYCEETGEEVETEEMMESSLNQVYNAYRVKHNLPFPEEIREIREKYDLSASKMSKILGFGVNQYKNYENGEIPSKSNANLILSAKKAVVFKGILENSDGLKEDEKKKLLSKVDRICTTDNNPFALNFDEILVLGETSSPSITNGYRKASLERIFNVLTFFAQQVKPYKTKLNKLFFYLDFSHYRAYGQSICGLEYRAIQHGPVPNSFDSIFQEAENQGYVERIVTVNSNYTSEQFIPAHKEFNSDLFSEREIASMKKVADRFKGTSTSKIVKISHEEEGWIKEEPHKGLIDYDYSYYLKYI